MNFRRKKKRFFTWCKRLSKKGTLSGSCSTMHAPRKGKSFRRDCLPWMDTEYHEQTLPRDPFLEEKCSDGSTYDACVSSMRIEGVFLRSVEKIKIFYFSISKIFANYSSELFKNVYIYFFLHMPLQFLGLLFIFRDISEISSKYERNTWAIWTSSKVLKKYRISSLSSFSYSCPFNFFRHFLLHLQDIVKMSHLNVTSKKNRIFWSIFLALSNSSLSYNFWNCIIFLLYNIFTNYPNIYKISKGFESFVTLLPRRNNSLDYPFSNLSDTFIFKIEEDFFKYSFLLFFFY